MEKHLSDKREQVISVQELVKNSTLSEENHDSTIEPFFQKSIEKNYLMNFKEIPELPESLNRHMKIFYELVGNPNTEVYIGDFTFMSLTKCLENYNNYCANDQKTVFDIGFRYAGMGHIIVTSCDLNNHLLFERMDGGSNGYDREANYKELLNYQTGSKKYIYFNQFKEKLMNPNPTYL
tara:strand:+ start:155 stop:691 length:537 start_codon:yes stop_codon:yes gene_type:complete